MVSSLEDGSEAASKLLATRNVVGLLGGSWDLVSSVMSTLSGVISNYNCSYLNLTPITESQDPPRRL